MIGEAMELISKLKSKKRELYDFTEYSAKMQSMISSLRSQKPGEVSGLVGKNEILETYKTEIQELVNDGYTIKQIAMALKSDVFSILPKSITQMLRQHKSQNPSTTSRAKKAVTKKITITEEMQTPKQPSSSFLINKDEQL
jgi:uncharacterized membrane protein YfhO